MFVNAQLFAFLAITALLASVTVAAPVYEGMAANIEPRQMYGNSPGGSGWIDPSKGKGRDGKARQAGEIWAVETQKSKDPSHPAVAKGNTAHVHDSWHSTHGGPDHLTVKYKDQGGKHVSTMHIDKSGSQIKGDSQGYRPTFGQPGGVPPWNSPSGSKKDSGSAWRKN